MAFSYLFIGLVDYRQLSVEKPDLKPVPTALSNIPSLSYLKVPVNLAIMLGCIGLMMITLLAQSRFFFAMSKDRLVPPVFSVLHTKWKTPWKSHLLFTLFTGAVAVFTPKAIISGLVSIGALFAFAMVCAGVMIMRYPRPDLPRRFKVPFYPLLPVLGIVSCIVLMYTLPVETRWRLIIWMRLSLIIFFIYSIKRVK